MIRLDFFKKTQLDKYKNVKLLKWMSQKAVYVIAYKGATSFGSDKDDYYILFYILYYILYYTLFYIILYYIKYWLLNYYILINYEPIIIPLVATILTIKAAFTCT